MESIQFKGFEIEDEVNNAINGPCVEAIIVDEAYADVSRKGICLPTKLTVDMGVGKIGASYRVEVILDTPILFGTVEWNGEKPQGMFLITDEFCVDGPRCQPV